ncbi:MAG: XRE family transcriptional regulator, partial [Steroidobacteraceae bacterium]
MDADLATIQALRGDLALQIARAVRARALTQTQAAGKLGIPQPTLSKIANGRTAELSLELLIRIAVRLQLPLVLQTGAAPEEAGVFVRAQPAEGAGTRSKLAASAREGLVESARHLGPEARLNAVLEHNRLVTALRDAGRRKGARASRRVGA